jgi:outer membrane protein assembly factor BamB
MGKASEGVPHPHRLRRWSALSRNDDRLVGRQQQHALHAPAVVADDPLPTVGAFVHIAGHAVHEGDKADDAGVGPAWSSVIVIGDRLFTQEQRGEQEMVVGYEASTGNEVWAHADPVRFWETVSGAGPRATPTFAGGRLFTLGATGILNCLEAATGQRSWSHDVAAEAPAKPPLWGYSSSPLVVEDKVIVFAGGEGTRNLLGYRTDSAPGDRRGVVNERVTRERPSQPSRPRVMRRRPQGRRRSVDRGTRRPAIELRNQVLRGADAVV